MFPKIRTHLLPSLILVCVTCLTFMPVLKADFIGLDDTEHVLENPAVRGVTAAHIRQAFAQNINGVAVPLTTLSFMVEYQFFGFNPLVFHLDNLLGHIAVVLLVFAFARRLGIGGAASFIAALIFAVHPMKVEAVAWVSARKDILFALFYLLCMHLYWSYLETRKTHLYALALAAAVLSLLAKPMAVSIPLILLLLDWYRTGRVEVRMLADKLPFVFCAGMAVVVSYALNAGSSAESIGSGLLHWMWCFTFYIWKFAYPWSLSPYYEFPAPAAVTSLPYAFSIAGSLALAVCCWVFRRDKLFVFAVLFYVCSIFFLLRFEHDRGFSVASDRYMYLSSLGFSLWLGSKAQGMWQTGHIWRILILMVLALLAVKSFQQCAIWQNSLVFWQSIYPAHKHNRYIAGSMGNAYYSAGRYNEALDIFNGLIAQAGSASAHFDRGRTWEVLGDAVQSRDDFNKSIALSLMNQEILIGQAAEGKPEGFYHLAFEKYVPQLAGLELGALRRGAEVLILSSLKRQEHDYAAAANYLRDAQELGVPVVREYAAILQNIKVK